MKNKKKVLVLTLLLFAVIGLAGYGVYSYYYTQGEFASDSASSEDDDNVIRITGSFNPLADTGSGSSGASGTGEAFLGNGGTLALECPESTGGHERITCTSSVVVKNEGSTGIYVEYYDSYSSASSSDTDVYAESPDFRWESGEWNESRSTYISAGSNKTLYVSVDVNVGDDEHISSGEAQLVNDPVTSGQLSASVSFRLEATQDHD